MPASENSFSAVFLRSRNKVGLSLLLVLAWIATSDGNVSEEEEAALFDLAVNNNDPSEVTAVLEVARVGQVEDLQLACEVLRLLNEKQRRLLLELAVSIALEDGYLVIPENHILRFLADLLNLGEEGLREVFHELTDHDFPSPGDSSSIEWWAARDRASNRQRHHARDQDGTGNEGSQITRAELERLRALAILGLDEAASHADIKTAYRRMAQVHHPDRYNSLGPEAVRAAEKSFKRIHAAYQQLTA